MNHLRWEILKNLRKNLRDLKVQKWGSASCEAEILQIWTKSNKYFYEHIIAINWNINLSLIGSRESVSRRGHTESTEGLARRPEGESQSTERRIVDDSGNRSALTRRNRAKSKQIEQIKWKKTKKTIYSMVRTITRKHLKRWCQYILNINYHVI